MARGRKSKPAAVGPTSVAQDSFIQFLQGINNSKQSVDDAQTMHARAFKKAESLGIHPDATKLVLRLAKMAGAKRSDFLRAFDKYRRFLDWDAQPDLLEQVASEDTEVEMGEGTPFAPDDARDDEDEDDSGRAEMRFSDDSERPDGDPMLEETAEAWDATEDEATDTEALDAGGNVFASGKEAGLSGAGPEESPHEAGGQSAEIWERGRAIGIKERVAVEAASIAEELDQADGDNVVNLFDEEDEIEPAVIAATSGGEGASAVAQ